MQLQSSLHSLLFHSFFSRLQVIFSTSPQKRYVQSQSSLHSLLFHRGLVTIASCFFQFPTKKLHMQWYSLIHNLFFHRGFVTIASHFFQFPTKKLHMQWYSLTHNLFFHKGFVTIASHFFNFPPKNSTRNAILWYTTFSFIEVLSRLQVIFFSIFSRKKLHMQWYSLIHNLFFHRGFVTIASHIFQFSPQKTPHAMVFFLRAIAVLTAQPPLS